MSFAFMPLYTGDYLRDTQHLSCSEHGIYLRLLMHCWDQRGPAPLDERKLCGIVNARSTDEIEALRRVIGEFFVKMDDGHYNKRMQQEVERANVVSGKRAGAALERWRARDSIRAIDAAQHANAMQVQSTSNASGPPPPPPPEEIQNTHPLPPRKRGGRAVDVDPAFARFWAAYPRHVAKAAAIRAFQRILPDEPLLAAIIDAIERQKRSDQWTRDSGAFIPHPATWLNNRRWEDEDAQPTITSPPPRTSGKVIDEIRKHQAKPETPEQRQAAKLAIQMAIQAVRKTP